MLANWAVQDKEFRYLYAKGKELIGLNRLNMCIEGKLDKSIYHRGVGLYDGGQHMYDRAEKKYDAELKAKAEIQEQMNLAQLKKALESDEIKQD